MSISKKTREAVYSKYDGHCAYCGREIAYKDMQVDHFLPQRAWGIEDAGTDNTLMGMKKSEIIECLRCAEHNQAVAEEQLEQHIKNVKDWVPVVRCRDCEYSVLHEDGEPYCIHRRGLNPETVDCFCSYGERRGER